jgi:hypothetical protein
MAFFELPELLFAKQSPSATKEDKDRWFAVLQIFVGKGLSVGEDGGEFGQFLVHFGRPGVRGRLEGPHNQVPLARAKQSKKDKENYPDNAAVLQHRHQHAQNAQRGHQKQVPGHD